MDWLTGAARKERTERQRWRRAWHEATTSPDAGRVTELRAQLHAMATRAVDDEPFEIEREMLEGLEAVVELASEVAAAGLPTIDTGHRAVGADRCHFSAPASLPDDPAQPSGTLLLAGTRIVFVGGARALTIPWHQVSRCVRQDRDLLVARADRQEVQRLRCNTFPDALRAAFLARQLASSRRV